MTDTTLPFADLEQVYERLANTLDTLPEGEERHFLAQLVLALAHRVPDVGQVMAANLHDVAQSWVMQPDGHFLRPDLSGVEQPFNCHRFFMENPSLSGRGSAGAADVPELTHSHD